MLKFHAMAMGGPSEAPGMRALKTNACAGTEKPPAGLSEAPLGVSQRLSGAKNSMSFPWGAACGGHRYGCLGELGGRGQSLGPLGTGRCVSGMRACTGRAHALSPLSGRSWATHRGSAISGHSARKPPRISAPHRHTLCACASGKNRGACVETGLCVPRPLRVPHVQKFWSACTDRPM